MTKRIVYQKLTQDGLDELLAFPTIKVGVPAHVHKSIVIQFSLWYGLSSDIFLSPVCDSHSDRAPARARDWQHYLKAIGI